MMVKIYTDSANSWIQTLIVIPISVAFCFVILVLFLSLFNLQNYIFIIFVPLSVVLSVIVFIGSHKVVTIYSECIVVSRGRFKWKYDELILFRNVRSIYYYASSINSAGPIVRIEYNKGDKIQMLSMRCESYIGTKELFDLFKNLSIEVGVHPESTDVWNLSKEYGIVTKVKKYI